MARIIEGSVTESQRTDYVDDGDMSPKDFNALLWASKKGQPVSVVDIAVDVGAAEDNYYIVQLECGQVIDHVHGSCLEL
jgi:hypothetical protein